MEGSLTREGTPARARVLLELAAEVLNAGSGHWRVSFELRDGDLLNVDRAEIRIGADDLRRFDRKAPRG